MSAQEGSATVNRQGPAVAVAAKFDKPLPPVPVVVWLDKPGPSISPSTWGIFFEDINMSADGGLYAELIKNRSFEFNSPLMGWAEHTTAPADGTVLVLNQSAENPNNPRFIRVTHFSDSPYGLSNEGFRGMGINESK